MRRARVTLRLKTGEWKDIMETRETERTDELRASRGQGVGQMSADPKYWNPENSLARVEGDEVLLRELIQLFLSDYPQTMVDLHAAISQGDVRSVERHAHTLKGSAANFEAGPVVAAGMQLETSGYRKDMSNVGPQVTELEGSLAKLRAELEAFLRTSP